MPGVSDVQIKCPVCHGRRSQKSILEVKYKGFSISDVLQMTIAEAAAVVALLNELVGFGNTVICVEHNLDVIAMSDWVVDFGPEGGDAGGEIIVQGTP